MWVRRHGWRVVRLAVSGRLEGLSRRPHMEFSMVAERPRKQCRSRKRLPLVEWLVEVVRRWNS